MNFELTAEEMGVLADALAVQPWHKVQALMGKIIAAMQPVAPTLPMQAEPAAQAELVL